MTDVMLIILFALGLVVGLVAGICIGYVERGKHEDREQDAES